MRFPLAERARRAERLGILGGSFDPVHIGHVHVAETARAAANLDHVVWIPAARPPHKPERVLADAGHRLAMLELALAGCERPDAHSLWGVELERVGPSYTVDTLDALARERGPAGAGELFLLLGSDSVPGLATWREVERILSAARPLVVAREGVGREVLEGLRSALSAEAVERLASGWIDAPPVPASSTELRERLAGSAPRRDDLPAGVWEYLERERIYAERRDG